MVSVLFVAALLHTSGLGLTQNLFQCQSSTSESTDGSVYTPNIPDFYFQHQNAAAFSTGFRSGSETNLTVARDGFTYIFTIPPGSCSGSIMAVQFCYRSDRLAINNQATNVFEFITATITDANLFTVTSRFVVQSVPQENICTFRSFLVRPDRYFCCDTQRIETNTDQFHILPSADFTYAIRILTSIRPLAFGLLARPAEVRVEQIQTGAMGESFRLGQSETNPLLLTRLIIESPDTSTTVPSTVTIPSTATTQSATTQSATTRPTDTTTPNESSTSSGPQDMTSGTDAISTPAEMPTTLQDRNMPLGVGNSETPPSTTSASRTPVNVTNPAPSSPGGSSTAAVVGGAVGGAIVGVLIGMVIITFCIIALMRKHRSKVYKRDDGTIDNAVYGKDMLMGGPGYAGSGPQASAMDYLNNEDNYYAECGAMSYEMPTKNLIGAYEEFSNFEAAYEQEPKSTIKQNWIAGPTAYEVPQQLSNPNYGEEPARWNEEDIYMVPAKDEDTLYTQLQSMLTTNLTRSSIKLGALLGSGQFGMVFKGVLENGEGEGVEVAVKTLKEGSGEEDRVKFLQEAAIMGQFKHHNVVTMYGVVTQGEPVLLVLELLSKGDLRGYLQNIRSRHQVSDHSLLSYCRQVASGMAYLSSKAFVHRDLAARNILVSDDEICKIADFGMSRDLMDESYYVSHGGKIPVKWTAPEALYYKKYSTASDVWSYGILMYEIWSVGLKPYRNCDNSMVLRLVDTGYRLPPPPGCPRALYTIMMSCWHPKASERPSFLELTKQLSLPDPKLLKWSEEDKSVHPEAAQLGADLQCGEGLYKDLQNRYEKTK